MKTWESHVNHELIGLKPCFLSGIENFDQSDVSIGQEIDQSDIRNVSTWLEVEMNAEWFMGFLETIQNGKVDQFYGLRQIDFVTTFMVNKTTF